MKEPDESDGGVLGPTAQCILAEQFSRLRRGDRFWHENEPDPAKHTDKTAFTPCQLLVLRKINLARIMCENSDDITGMPRRPFELGSGVVDCDKLPKINLNAWRTGFPCTEEVSR